MNPSHAIRDISRLLKLLFLFWIYFVCQISEKLCLAISQHLKSQLFVASQRRKM